MNIIVYLKKFIGIVNNGLTSRYFDRVYLLFLCARVTKWTGDINSIATTQHISHQWGTQANTHGIVSFQMNGFLLHPQCSLV